MDLKYTNGLGKDFTEYVDTKSESIPNNYEIYLIIIKN